MPHEKYRFDDFALDVTERRLMKGEESVALEPKTFDVLTALVRNAGHLLNKRDLLEQVWPDAFVEEGILSVHIARLRSALRRVDGRRYIETVPRAGYRFIAPVTTYTGVARPVADTTVEKYPVIHALVGQGRGRVLSASFFEVPKAVAAFESAIALNPTYAAAHAGLALARCAQAGLRLTPHLEAYSAARASAIRALALDDRCADAHAAMGTVLLMNDWDWVAAERAIERTLTLNANHSEACVLSGRLFDLRGNANAALAMKMKALERDADSPFVHLEIALSYWHQRKYDLVLDWSRRTLALDPKHLLAREMIIGVYWKQGDFDRQLSESIDHARTFGVPNAALQPLRDAYERDGRHGLITFSVEQLTRVPQPAQHLQLAILNGELGDLDRAFESLDRAIEVRDPALIYLAVAPQFDHLRSDSRFETRLTQLGLA